MRPLKQEHLELLAETARRMEVAIPDGFDFLPVTSAGRPDLGAIVHGP